MSGLTRDQEDDIAARAEYLCSRCGTREAAVIHNRHTTPPRNIDLAGGVLLCHACAKWAHADHVEAAVLGYWLLDGDDPTHVPVLIFGHGRVLLTSDGRYASQEVPF